METRVDAGAGKENRIPARQDQTRHLHREENKTYDQIPGDLDSGNGDPNLTEFGEDITPNEHNLARKFVDLDNFFDRSEVSMDGWPWTMDADDLDVVEHQTSVNYAGRGLSYDSEGDNRGVNVPLRTLAQRLAQNPDQVNDPDVLPGTADITAPDGPNGAINQGHIWDAVLRAGKTVRKLRCLRGCRWCAAGSHPYADRSRSNTMEVGLVISGARRRNGRSSSAAAFAVQARVARFCIKMYWISVLPP